MRCTLWRDNKGFKMKKIIAFIAFSVSYNLCAAQEAPEIMQITKQTEIAQTKTDKQTPSFWVRHADKLKKVSYGIDIFFLASFVMGCATLNEKNDYLNDLLIEIFICCIIAKLFFDPITNVAMNKKHTFELEALQAKLDAAQQETNTETPA